MKIGFERVRFVLWFVLVVVLLTAMFSVWRSMFSDTLDTALEMTRLQLIDRANAYKQEWVLQGRPAPLTDRTSRDSNATWVGFSQARSRS